MIIDPYNARVRELFTDLRHAGTLPDAVTVTREDQGISIELSAALLEGRIDKLRYRMRGCPHSMAACEAICRQFEGAAPAQLFDFSAVELMQTLAVPAAKSGRILALEDTVRELETALRGPKSSAGQDE